MERGRFLDSGAFSAFTKGIQINIQDYIDFIKGEKGIFAHYSVLDEIGDAEKTLKNQRIMEKQKLNPVPCFHHGEDFKFLKQYCDNYEYIALGGLVPLSRRRGVLKEHLSNCFSFIRKYKNKIHIFGISAKYVLENFPAYSCDSTSAFEGSIRGSVTRISTGEKLDPKKDMLAFSMIDKGKPEYKKRVQYMMKETKMLEDYITELWLRKGVKWKN